MPHPTTHGPLITTAVVMIRSRSPGIATQLCRQLAPGKTHSHDQAHDTDQGPLARPGVAGIGTASFLADVGHEIPTALLPNLLTVTLGAPAAALGLIEGIADGLAGAARLAGGAIADDLHRRRAQAVAGDTPTTAVLSRLIGAATTVWQLGILRAGAWAARGLRIPARNALLADIVPASVYGRAYGFERAMDNLGAIAGPPARPGPGRPGRGPHGHRPVHHPGAAGRPGHRVRHPPHPPGRAAGAATAAATGAAGAGRAPGSAHGRGVGL